MKRCLKLGLSVIPLLMMGLIISTLCGVAANDAPDKARTQGVAATGWSLPLIATASAATVPKDGLKARPNWALRLPPSSPAMPLSGSKSGFRRPLSPRQPMFLIHADTWNAADPQKIIDLIPADIRPYAVLMISLSINHDGATGDQCNWRQVENGIETARSWLKTAAENGVWAMVQPSSGGFSHFPDYPLGTDLESTVYGEFFRDYPNFLGFNYAEQFWGFDEPCSVTVEQRWEHWANLLKLTHKYGGYLAASFTGGYYGAGINPLAMVKRNEALRTALSTYSKNFIMEEKFTSRYGSFDIQSVTLGMYLSGYAGHYGIRPDRTGWYSTDGSDYPVQAGASHLMEHLTLTGQTVFDGPELIPWDTVNSLPNGTTDDGYTTRRWEFHPHFKNIHMDIYRKILDGTLRILSRREVIDRTKVVIVNDVTTGNDQDRYSSPRSLFSGLYLMDDDGTYVDQHNWYKKTGRYPAIPTVWNLRDDLARSFKLQVPKSDYAARWPSIEAKQNALNAIFPQEYTGDIYAGRQNNTWITYNPYKTAKTANGTIPLKYNSCAAIQLDYAQFTSGIISEFPNGLLIYLNNYGGDDAPLKSDTITISGANQTPTFSFVDRGQHQPSVVNGTASPTGLTLKVDHNGPLDIRVQCKGSASNRLKSYARGWVWPPGAPPVYTGVHQYEAENFDFSNIASMVANGVSGQIRNYQGLGYINFGTSDMARVRERVTVREAGNYRLLTRYSLSSGTVNSVDLYVNGSRYATPVFAQTGSPSTWATNTQTVQLTAGTNTIEFRASAARPEPIYFDNVVLSR
jgi:hypothetical protein